MKKLLVFMLCLTMVLSCAPQALADTSAGASLAKTAYHSDPHNLSDFGYRTVTTYGSGDCLVFQSGPGGSVLEGHQFWEGDQIYVNLYWREQGYAIAYDDGIFGYVDASYIQWKSGDSTGGSSYSSDIYNLSGYGYRTVSIGQGGGSLIFQSSPGGAFLNEHKFWNGDQIYVNLTYRNQGYALAYEDGVYGYVDASYINWESSGTSAYDPHNLSDFGYRTVRIASASDSLIFQTSPGGSFLTDHKFQNGDQIYVNLYWREQGYAIAYENGVYGYVDASYINWGSSSPSAYDPHNLSDFGYRTVRTASASDSLIFQTSPGGSFLTDHKFWNGDRIYVNLYWREQGYAIAYDGGVYGYVDASYISW